MSSEWDESTTVDSAALYLGLSVAETARLVVSGVLRARVLPGSRDANLETVHVCAADVYAARDADADAVADRLEASRILRRRRAKSGWPPPWEGASRVYEVPPDDRCQRVMRVVRALAKGSGWVAVSAVSQRMAGQRWVNADSVGAVVRELVEAGRLELDVRRSGRVGRPSSVVRLTGGWSDEESDDSV